jgi:OmpA-OmpF porin, OOP family
MTSTPTFRPLIVASLCALTAGAAFAQNNNYPYVGLSIGESRARLDEQDISNRVLVPGTANTVTGSDSRDTAYKGFVGYQFNRYIGAELGFFDLGKFTLQSSTAPAGTLDGNLRFRGANLDLVGTLPFTDRFAAIGRVGALYTRTRGHFSGSGAANVVNPTPSKRDTTVKWGAGLQYAISPSLLMRVEGERYRIHDAVSGRNSVDLYTVSLVIPFGRTAAPSPRMAAAPVREAPAPVAAAPTPTPAPVVVVQAPPPPMAQPVMKQRVSFSAESLFSFDKDAVQPEGRAALDSFSQKMSGTQFDRVSVEGHTDRLGSNDYNDKLSVRRAESVKSYLVTSGGLDAMKVNAVGKGEGSPTSQTNDCKGNRATTALIACLQADRRVDIEVSGSR